MTQLFIAPDHVLPSVPTLGVAAVAGQHYFTVRLKTLHLQSGRDWFSEHLPLLSTAAEFIHGDQQTAVPFMVGPRLISDTAGPMPSRVDFKDTRLANTSPYCGGDLTVSVLLSRVSSEPKVARMLSFIEDASGVMKKTGALAPYAAVADLVAGALDDLANNNESAPLFGAHLSLSQDNGTLASGYLLIAAADLDSSAVWLVDSEVRIGRESGTAVPLTNDHVLLAIELASERSDADTLPPVAEHWPHVVDFAGRPEESSWVTAKSWLSILAQELYLSPDLTRPQAEQLYQHYVETAVGMRDKARALAHLGPTALAPSDLLVMRNIDEDVRTR